jgi:hypothetical protein
MDEMHIFQHRLNSFGKRGCNWPHKHFKATALRLAQVGFYYDSKGLYNDKVSCYLCKCSYHGWKKDDIPMEIHKKTSPQCPLVEILDYSKEWVRNPTEDQTYEPISSHLLKSRIETYSNWWPHTYPNITPERMAEAGFYYSPDIELEDKVECAYCKAKFGNWTHNDNPRSKHFRFNEKCPFFCVAKLKRRRLKKKDNESKKNKKNRKDDELTDNSSNKSIEKNNKKKKADMEIDDSNKKNDNDNNSSKIKIKKTYNTRYATREIKKVDYVEKDSDDELFYSTSTDESEKDEENEEKERDDENEVEGKKEGEYKDEEEEEEDDDKYVDEMEDDSILIDDNVETLKKGNNKEKEDSNYEKDHILENNTEENESIINKENKKSEEVVEEVKTKKKYIKIYGKEESDNDEYINSIDSDFSSTSYEEMLIKKESTKKKKPKRKYKKRKKSLSINDPDESILVDDELDSEEEELRNKEIKRLFSTDNYLGPLPKIKSKNVIKEEKKLYEEMVKQAEENSSEPEFDIKNTDPEFVSVTSILKKRKKENFYEFDLNPKRISLGDKKTSINSPENNQKINDKNENNNNNHASRDNDDDNNEKVEKNDKNNLIGENGAVKTISNKINQYLLKTPITIQKIKKEKDFTIVKVLNTINQSTKYSKNLLETISKQQIEDAFKNTPIKLIDNNQNYMTNTPLNFSEEDIHSNNVFMIDDENNLEILKEKIIEILIENSKNANEEINENNENNENDEINEYNENNHKNEINENNENDKINENNEYNDNSMGNNKNDTMDIDEEYLNSDDNQPEVIETLDEKRKNKNNNIENDRNKKESDEENKSILHIKEEISKLKISPLKQDNELNSNNKEKENCYIFSDTENKNNYEEIEESLKYEKTTDKKRKEFYEIKSSDKKILKELSFSITTPEPNSPPKINSSLSKFGNKTFKTPLSSQVKNFLSSDILIEETIDALLSTPTPLPLSLGPKSHFKNDKELLKKTILEENKMSLKKLKKSYQSNPKLDTKKKETNNSNISDNTKFNKNLTNTAKSNDENISFLSYDDNNLSFMFKNDDSIVIRSKQKADDNLERIVGSINKLKETIDTVNDSSMILDEYKPKKNFKSTDSLQKDIKEYEDINDNEHQGLNNDDNDENINNNTDKKANKSFVLSSSFKNSVNEEEILDNYFNYLTTTPSNVKNKKNSINIKKEENNEILSMTVGQYLEKINQDIAEKLKIEGEKKIYGYYQQLFSIEDLYIQYLDKMVDQLQEYPKDKKILESQTKLMKNNLNNDRKNIKMKIDTDSI